MKDVMKMLHLEIMGKLEQAIHSGNFADLCDGPFIEMENDSGERTYHSDLTPFQRAKLNRDATALFWSYSSLINGSSKWLLTKRHASIW